MDLHLVPAAYDFCGTLLVLPLQLHTHIRRYVYITLTRYEVSVKLDLIIALCSLASIYSSPSYLEVALTSSPPGIQKRCVVVYVTISFFQKCNYIGIKMLLLPLKITECTFSSAFSADRYKLSSISNSYEPIFS